MSTVWHYWLLTTMLALAGTGGFSFFRSLLSDLSPPDQAAKIFGFSSSIGRLSGFLGPLAFGVTAHLTENVRLGFVPVVLFLVVAFGILMVVDFDRGRDLVAAGVPPHKAHQLKPDAHGPDPEVPESSGGAAYLEGPEEDSVSEDTSLLSASGTGQPRAL